jgi:ketosteroid isomerase-like protein
MSQENVEIVRRAIDAFNRGGVDAALEFLDREIEWTTTGIFVKRGTYRGHEGARRYMGALAADLDDLHTEPEEFIDAGEQIVVPFHPSAAGKRSGAPVVFSGARVYGLEGGKIKRIHNYTEKAEALAAAGVAREDGRHQA